MAELRARHGGCPTGQAVATTAGALPASWVIHAVGPVWAGGGRGEAGLLAAAYESAFDRAEELGARSMTLPAISCGIYGYPLDDGAAVAVQAVARRLAAGGTVERATFVLFSEATFRAFRDALEALNPAA